MNKTALVTGASAGIGQATALRLASMGITTYAAARRLDRMEHLKEHGIRVLPLDLTSEDSIWECSQQIGAVDILVNNAGYGSYGAVEEVPMVEARRQLEVNLLGLASLTQLVIPHMREQRWGKIVNVTSVGGLQAAPYGGWYHATKFAVEGLSSSLRQELRPFGVDVILIRPGAILTEWGDIAADSLLKTSGEGPYHRAARALHKLFTGPQLRGMAGSPEDIAEVIGKAITARCPSSAYTAPREARLMVLLSKLAGSDRVRDGLTRALMGLPSRM